MDNRRSRIAAAVATAVVLFGACDVAQATVINLQAAGVTGTGSTFCGAGNAQDVTVTAGGYKVVLSGGTPLGPNITNLPATDSIAYGTEDPGSMFCDPPPNPTGYSNPVTISFFDALTNSPEDVSNFFVTLYNGNTATIAYTLSDNLGNSLTFNLASNLSGGNEVVGFPAAGDVISLFAGPSPANACCEWDFFFNDIGFNQPIPTPEPLTLWLFGSGLAGAAWMRRRKRVQ